jgi:hypothetical protein
MLTTTESCDDGCISIRGASFADAANMSAYPSTAPATAGAFYFFRHTNKPTNQPPLPGTIAINAT